jgi:TolB-like protein/class 3 adenylate cyclase/Flp pilus assembly protein TadD
MPPVRRLTAILAADVAGYSRLMGQDEEGTHERLRAHLGQLVEPKIAEYRGRTVKNTGDGFLAEFASVIDAVRCAVEAQRGMADRNAATLPEDRIEFRVGINLGDVIAEEEDIFGDGVNVAARLEGLAEPGGICVSRVVRDQVRDRFDYTFQDMGEQQVKNIARPVRVYAWRPKAIADPRATSAPPLGPVSQSTGAPRLSIVVLPFANLSNDAGQGYFADGITEDLTTDLSRIAGMFVISRNTAFTYRNKPIDTKQIGRELNVRYVMEGSVRRSDNQIRINAQLIDAETDAHLWAERFDGARSDLLALQDEVTTRIAISLNLELIAAEAARPKNRPDVLDYILRARAAAVKPPSPDNSAAAISLFERALALDPRSAEAQSWLAVSLAGSVLSNSTSSRAADLQRAEELSEKALASRPHSPLAHFAKGQVLRAQRRFTEAIHEYETVLASDRNWVYAFFALGQCKLYNGFIDEAIPLVERAIRLSPRDPQLGIWYETIGLAHLLQSRTIQAITWLEKARNYAPAHSIIRAQLASAYALDGQIERATTELAEACRLSADNRFSSVARLRAVGTYGVPEIHALRERTYVAGLRTAGLPEE